MNQKPVQSAAFEADPLLGNTELPPRQLTDQEIEALLSTSLPQEKRLSVEKDGELLKAIREAPEDLRNTDAEIEYLSYRARTICSVIENIAPCNGLMLEDYFQIGCETVLREARGERIAAINYSSVIFLNHKIKTAIEHAIENMRFAGMERPAQTDETSGDDEIASYIDGEIARTSNDPYEEVEKAEVAEILKNASIISVISDSEIRIIELKYGLKLTEGVDEHPQTKSTLSSIGEELGITKEEVRRLDEKILKKLLQNPNLLSIRDSTIKDWLRDRTPLVVTDNGRERRAAERLGHKVCGELVLKILDDLETGIYYAGAPSISRISSRCLLRGSHEEIAKKASLINQLTGIWGTSIQASNGTPSTDQNTRSARAIDIKSKISRRLMTPDQVWGRTNRQ